MEEFKLSSIGLSALKNDDIELDDEPDKQKIKKSKYSSNKYNSPYQNFDSDSDNDFDVEKLNKHKSHNHNDELNENNYFKKYKSSPKENQYKKHDINQRKIDLFAPSSKIKNERNNMISDAASFQINNYAQIRSQLGSLTANLDQLEKIENEIVASENENQVQSLKNQKQTYQKLYLKSLKSLVKKSLSKK